MHAPLRRALAAGLVTAAAAATFAVPLSAEASNKACDAPTVAASLATAKAEVAQAKAAFKAANRPLGKLVSAKRHEAKAEIKQSVTALRALDDEAGDDSTGDGAEAVRAQVRAERHDIAEARNLLTYKRAMLAEIKADRLAARTAYRAATSELHRLAALEDSCSDSDD